MKQELIKHARELKEMCSKLGPRDCAGCPFFIKEMDGCVLADEIPFDWELDEVDKDD